MKALLVNADDFGRHPLINEAVLRAVEHKGLLSASLMAGEPYFEEAVAIAKSHPMLGVGVHLTLVNGRPVLPPQEIPSLVCDDGSFYPHHNAFIKKYLTLKIRKEDVVKELSAQIDKVIRAGITPTHVDSHQHIHMLPGIFPKVLNLAQKNKINKIRISGCGFANPFIPWPGFGDLIGKCALQCFSMIDTQKAQKAGFLYPGHFVGQVAGGAITADFMQNLLKNMHEDTVEVMLHPGMNNRILSLSSGWDHDYEAEFLAVTCEKVHECMQKHGIKLINFGDL